MTDIPCKTCDEYDLTELHNEVRHCPYCHTTYVGVYYNHIIKCEDFLAAWHSRPHRPQLLAGDDQPPEST